MKSEDDKLSEKWDIHKLVKERLNKIEENLKEIVVILKELTKKINA